MNLFYADKTISNLNTLFMHKNTNSTNSALKSVDSKSTLNKTKTLSPVINSCSFSYQTTEKVFVYLRLFRFLSY